MTGSGSLAQRAEQTLKGGPLVPPTLAFLVGVGIAPTLPTFPGQLLLVLLLLIVAAIWSHRPLFIVSAACLWLAVAGVIRTQTLAVIPASDISALNGQFVELIGVVDAEPDIRDKAALLRVRVEQAATGSRGQPTWVSHGGIVQVRVPLFPQRAFGDRLDIRGRLQDPPVLPDFDYRAYLARQGIHSVMSYAALTSLPSAQPDPLHASIIFVRDHIDTALAQALPEPEASLQRAILIGSHSAAFSDLAPDFVRTGMIHIIATSGFKVAIVGGTLLELGTLLVGRRRAVWPALALGTVYIALTGATPAGVRAGLMWAVALGALVAGRPNASFQGLLVAAGGMVALQPDVLTDSGFQLSAGATAGILLFMPRLEPWLQRLPGWLAEPVGVTLAAQLGTLPVSMTGFQQVSLVAPLANLLCLPMLAASMAMGGVSVVLASVLPQLGHLAGAPAYGFLLLMIGIVEALAQLPYAFLAAPSSTLLFAALYYAGLLLLLLVWPSEEVHRLISSPTPAARLLPLALIGVGVPVVLFASQQTSGGGVITALDASTGDSMLVQDQAGHSILFDTGPVARTTLAQVGQALPFWQNSIDTLAVLGSETAHVGALPELATRYHLASAILPPTPSRPSNSEQSTRSAAPTNATLVTNDSSGVQINGAGVRVQLWDVGTNATPHVLARIAYGQAILLDAASLSTTDQRRALLAGVPLSAAVLVAPGGATAAALDPGFLLAVHPAYILAGTPPKRQAAISPEASPFTYDSQLVILHLDQLGALRLIPSGNSFVIE